MCPKSSFVCDCKQKEPHWYELTPSNQLIVHQLHWASINSTLRCDIRSQLNVIAHDCRHQSRSGWSFPPAKVAISGLSWRSQRPDAEVTRLLVCFLRTMYVWWITSYSHRSCLQLKVKRLSIIIIMIIINALTCMNNSSLELKTRQCVRSSLSSRQSTGSQLLVRTLNQLHVCFRPLTTGRWWCRRKRIKIEAPLTWMYVRTRS